MLTFSKDNLEPVDAELIELDEPAPPNNCPIKYGKTNPADEDKTKNNQPIAKYIRYGLRYKKILFAFLMESLVILTFSDFSFFLPNIL